MKTKWILASSVLLIGILGIYMLFTSFGAQKHDTDQTDSYPTVTQAEKETLQPRFESEYTSHLTKEQSVESSREEVKNVNLNQEEYSFSAYWHDKTDAVTHRFAQEFNLSDADIEKLNRLRSKLRNYLAELDLKHSSVAQLPDGSIRIEVDRYPQLGADVYSQYVSGMTEVLGDEGFKQYSLRDRTLAMQEVPNIGLLRKVITIDSVRDESMTKVYGITVERYSLLLDDIAGTEDEVLVFKSTADQASPDKFDRFAVVLKELLPSS